MFATLIAFFRRWFMPLDPVAPLPPPLAVPDVLVPAPGEVGVMYTPPPEAMLPDIMRKLNAATAEIEPGSMVLAGVADRKGGWNSSLGVVTKDGFQAHVWIGKSYGQSEVDYGVRVMKVWKLGKS